MQEMSVIDIDTLHTARKHVKKSLATLLQSEFERVYTLLASQISAEYKFTPEEVSRRRLKNTCLDYLCSLGTVASLQRAKAQYDGANCMTDRVTALACLASRDSVERSQALAHFYAFTDKDPLMLNKWFSIQAMADLPNLLASVKDLRKHPDFTISNPNRARSLLSVFAGNYAHFHAADGEGYRFIADNVIELDALNPQVAARMASAFSQWKRFDTGRQALMRAQLERIQATKGLSKDTYEVVTRCLK